MGKHPIRVHILSGCIVRSQLPRSLFVGLSKLPRVVMSGVGIASATVYCTTTTPSLDSTHIHDCVCVRAFVRACVCAYARACMGDVHAILTSQRSFGSTCLRAMTATSKTPHTKPPAPAHHHMLRPSCTVRIARSSHTPMPRRCGRKPRKHCDGDGCDCSEQDREDMPCR